MTKVRYAAKEDRPGREKKHHNQTKAGEQCRPTPIASNIGQECTAGIRDRIGEAMLARRRTAQKGSKASTAALLQSAQVRVGNISQGSDLFALAQQLAEMSEHRRPRGQHGHRSTPLTNNQVGNGHDQRDEQRLRKDPQQMPGPVGTHNRAETLCSSNTIGLGAFEHRGRTCNTSSTRGRSNEHSGS